MVPGGCAASVVGGGGGGADGVDGDDVFEPPLEHALSSRMEKALNFLENMTGPQTAHQSAQPFESPRVQASTVGAAI